MDGFSNKAVGAWCWDLGQEEVVDCTQGMYDIYGLDPARPQLLARDWHAMVLAEDQPAYFHAVDEALRSQSPLCITYRIRRPDGAVRLLLDQGQVVAGEDGRPLRMFGSTQDITEQAAAERELAKTLSHLRTVMNATPDIICLKDAEGRWLEANASDLRLFGLERVDYRGKTDAELADYALPQYRDAFLHCMETDEKAWRAGVPRRGREDIPDRHGTIHHFDVLKVPLFDEQGRRSALVVYGRDNSILEQAIASLGESERLLRSLMEASPDFMLIKDGEGRWREMNPAGERLYGLAGKPWRGLTDEGVAELAFSVCREGLRGCTASDEMAWAAGGATRGIELLPQPDDGLRVFDVIKVPLFDARGRRENLVILGRDITERAQAEARLEHAAMHDALTGLANRSHFVDRLNHALSVLPEQQSLAVIFLDLDHFKAINDTYGHHVGDALLQQVASRFRSALREGDLLARLGGDEFVVLLEGLDERAEAEEIARRLIRGLGAPFQVDALSLFVTGSAGISFAPRDAGNATTLMMYADSAMYRAKELGRNTYAFYEGGLNDAASERLMMLGDLRSALEKGGLRLNYQPQLDAAGLKVESVEALARWHHPQRGPIPPDRFVAMAEDGGLILQLGAWVLRTACEQAVHWQERLGIRVRMAVNVSPLQLQHPDFLAQVIATLDETGLAPDLLEIEITESALLRDPERALQTLIELKALGVRVALDDFGTGYSSLGYLKRFPFDLIKIDRSFVRDILADPGDLAIVRAIIAMGHSLGLLVVAEGVETNEQRLYLESLGCDLLQGYLIGRPAPASEVERLFDQCLL